MTVSRMELETIKNIISNLYYEIMLLSMTGSRMELETIKNIISNLYYEILLLSMTGSRMLLKIIKIYAVNKIATRCNFINRRPGPAGGPFQIYIMKLCF